VGDADQKRRLPVVDGPVRNDLDDGLRFVHMLGMQVKHDLFETSARLGALVEELVANGHIDALALDERRARIRDREAPRQVERAHVQVADLHDKYDMQGLPEIPCAELIPLCKARCCKLAFRLSFQDLDEGVVEWDYAMPYVIRRRPTDGRCVHQGAEGACGVYDKRPASCRKYDCRSDPRIWADFAKKIPAGDDAI